jgi:hypothetical protein
MQDRQIERYTPQTYASTIRTRFNLDHYIAFYPDVIPPRICEDLIAAFELNPDLHISHNGIAIIDISANITLPEWKATQEIFVEACSQGLGKYAEDIYFDATRAYPEELGLESLLMQRLTNDQKGGRHVDITGYSTAKRFLSVAFFLNTVSGGEVEFKQLGISFSPQQGSMLIYPSAHIYPHQDMPPDSVSRYTISTFVHYTP